MPIHAPTFVTDSAAPPRMVASRPVPRQRPRRCMICACNVEGRGSRPPVSAERSSARCGARNPRNRANTAVARRDPARQYVPQYNAAGDPVVTDTRSRAKTDLNLLRPTQLRTRPIRRARQSLYDAQQVSTAAAAILRQRPCLRAKTRHRSTRRAV